jgi:hypothetical protein
MVGERNERQMGMVVVGKGEGDCGVERRSGCD